MKVVRMTGARPPLVQDSAARPEPGAGELLIRVSAAGVTPTELGWYPTLHTRTGEPRAGAIPAHEFSGAIAEVGHDVGLLEVGREVYGMNDWFSQGALAEYCIAPFFAVAPKPAVLSHADAASVPISALTAWQGLLDRAHLKSGDRVLVHGAAGAVGIFAVQLARLHGAHVTATASQTNAEFVRSLGAEQVIDYRSGRFEEHAGPMDVVFDTVGGETLQRSWSVLKPDGRMVTIASSEEDPADPRNKAAFFIVEPNQKQLCLVAALLESGKLRTVVDTVVPLAGAADAYSGKLPRQHRGKMVVAIANAN